MLYPTPLLRYPDYDSLISDLVAAKQQLLYPSAHKTMAPAQARVPAKTKRSFFMMSSAVLLLVGIGIALLVFYNGNLVNRLGKLAKGHAWMQRASPTPPPIEAPLPVGAFTVSSTYPAHDAKILDYTCRQIIVRFNHPVNKSTLKNVKLVGEGVTGLGLPEFDDSVSASFKIVGSLQPGHQYKITVPTKVLDADGKPLARKCQFSFSTE